MFSNRKGLWSALILALGVQACGDLVCGQVDMNLTVRIQDPEGRAVENAEVFLVHHRLRGRQTTLLAETPVCRTLSSGICSANIRYRYSEERFFWQTAKNSRNRFELRTIRNGELRSLGFLQELTPAQIQGVEEINVLMISEK